LKVQKQKEAKSLNKNTTAANKTEGKKDKERKKSQQQFNP